MDKFLFGLFFIFSFYSCSDLDRRTGLDWINPQKVVSAVQLKKTRKDALKHWTRRHERESLRQALKNFETLAYAEPENLDVLVYLTRGYYLMADAHTTGASEKKDIWEIGAMWGERALATNKEFKMQIKDGVKMHKALGVLDKRYVPAVYWLAANLGKWAKLSGITTQLKMKAQIKKMIQIVEKYSPDFFYGAVSRYWGAYYAIAPGFAGGSMAKSKQNFQRAFKQAPEYLGSFVLYAENYATRQGDKQEFEKILHYVVDKNLRDEAILPENLIEKKKARELLSRSSDFF